MKKIIGIICTFGVLLLVVIAKSQEAPNTGPINPVPDLLYINQFDLTQINALPSTTNSLLLSTSDFFQKFGNPNGSAAEYSEELENNSLHYFYSGMDVWYNNDRLQAINITSADFAFKLTNGTTIKVGDNINNVVNLFPNSWNNVQFPGQVFVSLGDNNGPVDMNLLFEYSTINNIITSISVQE